MILSLLYKLSPEQCRLILIDPKMLELSVYDGIPHLLSPVVTEPAKAVTALKWTVREMERRYRAMSQLGVRNVGGYNERVAQAQSRGEVVTRRVQTGFDPETGRPTFEEQPLALERLPFIVVVIDEMADLMMTAGKEIEAAVQRLAQMARAAGIHVIMATQRPSVDVITGTIKANFPTRISFQVISKFDSRTILGEQGAEQLLGQGDLLYMQGGGRIGRVHGPFVGDEEVEGIVAFLRSQGEPAYLEEVTEGGEEEDGGPAPAGNAGGGNGDGEKGLLDQAIDVVARHGKAVHLLHPAPPRHRLQPRRQADRADGEGGDHHPRQPRREARGPGAAHERGRVGSKDLLFLKKKKQKDFDSKDPSLGARSVLRWEAPRPPRDSRKQKFFASFFKKEALPFLRRTSHSPCPATRDGRPCRVSLRGAALREGIMRVWRMVAAAVLLLPGAAGARPASGAAWGTVVGEPATYERHTAPGQAVRIASYAHWNGRCEPIEAAEVQLLAPPAHGRIELRPGTRTVRGEPRFGSTDCTGHVLPSVEVFYVPAPGFTGADRFEYRLSMGQHVAHETAVLTVQ